MRNQSVSDQQVTNDSPATTSLSADVVNQPGAVVDALARVQEAVADVQESALQESVEAAIEAIDAGRATLDGADGDHLAVVADALEQALDEIEKGKVANLLPVIEQAQAIIQSGTTER